MNHFRIAQLLVGVVLSGGMFSAEAKTCTVPLSFVDTPHPKVAPVEDLVSRVEEVTIERSLADVLASNESSNLEDSIDPDSPLVGVTGTYTLTDGEFWVPGSRRIVCLSDDTTLVEQVLLRDTTSGSHHFRYVVWNYGTEAARPIHYGLGEFIYTETEPNRTHVKWTYSFALKGDVFPGYLGGLGQWLFRISFLDRDYAKMMQGTLARTKARAVSGR